MKSSSSTLINNQHLFPVFFFFFHLVVVFNYWKSQKWLKKEVVLHPLLHPIYLISSSSSSVHCQCPLSVRPFQRSERGTSLSHIHRNANDFKAPLALSQPRHAPTPHSLSTKIRVLASHFEHCLFISLESKSLFVTPFSASSNVQNASQPEILARSEADRKFAGELMESERFSFQCSLFHGANGSVHLMRAVQISLQASIRCDCFRGNTASS